MLVTPSALPDVLLLEPQVFEDERGLFLESFNLQQFQLAVGASVQFVQDNLSHSRTHVLRGLHYQKPQAQGKLIQVVSGQVFDVTVDLRRGSPTFGRWAGYTLSANNHCQLWIPEGFAHGFLTLSETADVLYKVTRYYAPEHEQTLAWNDPELNIQWPLEGEPVLSQKDRQAGGLQAVPLFD